MAKKSTDKKSKETKGKKPTPKPVRKVEEPKEEVFDEVVSNEEEKIDETILTETPDVSTETEEQPILVEETVNIIEEVQLNPEIFRGCTLEDTFIKASQLETKTEKPDYKRFLNEDSNKYEVLPLKPMKRDPKNIFFKVKKKIKMIFE